MFGYKKARTANGKLKIHCWSETNTKRPWEVPLLSSQSYFFVCDQCDKEFSLPLTYVVQGHWCPRCTDALPPPKNNYTVLAGPSFAGFT